MSVHKPSYRSTKPELSTSVKVIITLLVVLVITLAAFLIKVLVSQNKIEYHPVVTDEYEETKAIKTERSTETVDPAADVKAVERGRFDTRTGPLILVNKNTAYQRSEPQSLVNLFDEDHKNINLDNTSIQLDKEAYNALYDMTNAYADRSGYCPLMIVSGYRDKEAQQKYYDGYVVNESDKDYVELPGYSDHHTGLGFDVKIYDKDGSSYSYGRYAKERAAWIVENYEYYGFIMRYPANKGNVTGIAGESNHFRYVGLPHSVYITDNNICLEEYLALIKNRSYENPLKITADGTEYSVWYCGGESVFVPKDKEYTVSGDNLGGFIVTVKNDT